MSSENFYKGFRDYLLCSCMKFEFPLKRYFRFSGEKITLSITILLALAVNNVMISEKMPPSSKNSPILGNDISKLLFNWFVENGVCSHRNWIIEFIKWFPGLEKHDHHAMPIIKRTEAEDHS